jgi:hypothetical protein
MSCSVKRKIDYDFEDPVFSTHYSASSPKRTKVSPNPLHSYSPSLLYATPNNVRRSPQSRKRHIQLDEDVDMATDVIKRAKLEPKTSFSSNCEMPPSSLGEKINKGEASQVPPCIILHPAVQDLLNHNAMMRLREEQLRVEISKQKSPENQERQVILYSPNSVLQSLEESASGKAAGHDMELD